VVSGHTPGHGDAVTEFPERREGRTAAAAAVTQAKTGDVSVVTSVLTRLRASASAAVLLQAGPRPEAGAWAGDIDLLVCARPEPFLAELHAAAASQGFSAVLQAPRIFNTLEIDLLFAAVSSWTAVFVDEAGTVLHFDVVFASGPPPPPAPGAPPLGLPQIAPELGLSYLILKRLRKEDHSSETWEAISVLARGRAPSLRPYLGRRLAEEVSAAVGAGAAPSAASVRRAHRAMRRRHLGSARSPGRLARGSLVALRRVSRPAGAFISLGGVDGSGKSAVTDAVVAWSPFRRVRRLHSRPGLLKPPGWFIGRRPSDGSDPHGARPWGRGMSALRLVYFWADFTVGYWLRIWPVRARGGLVVSERWWWDMYVDPHRHRLQPMPRAARLLGRLVPRPDSFLLLDAPSDPILKRKQEVDAPEIERQRAAWARLAPAIANLETVDAGGSLAEVVDTAIGAVVERQRHRIGRPAGVAAGGDGLVAWPRSDPRWLIDPGDPRSLDAALRLYLPSRVRALAAARAAALMMKRTRSAAPVMRRLATEPTPDARRAVQWVREAAAVRWPERDVGVAGYLGSPGVLRKLSAVVLDGAGRPLLFAKVASTAAAADVLRHEADVLRFARDVAPGVAVPDVVAVDTDERGTLLLLTPVSGSRFGNRAPLTERHVHLVSELHARRRARDGAEHRDALTGRLNRAPDTVQAGFLRDAVQSTRELWPAVRSAHFSHGDLTPWNCLDGRDALGVVDWEMAGYRTPGWDVFHYLMQIESITRTSRPARAAERVLSVQLPAAACEAVLAAADIDLPRADRWRALQLQVLIEGAVDLLTAQPELSRRGIELRLAAVARLLGIAPPVSEPSRPVR
jgi:thymidylate kinase